VHDEGDHCDDDEEMNRGERDLEYEQTENPDDEEYERESEKHGSLSSIPVVRVTCTVNIVYAAAFPVVRQ
jgi:hypothetical protein